ncbi:interleukin-21 [Sorex araneus]|uniref:interleukin-21 n=1 Tax=Sorex araneus TaxID=42254 RepID=UPI0024334F2E|nr:interleukin-21 [Sorex araneus]
MLRLVLCLVVIGLGTETHTAGIQGPDRLMIRMRYLLDIVGRLQTLVDKLGPATLPAPQDVKRHCERSAFSCFQKEQLRPVSAEENETISLLTKQLRRKLPPAPKNTVRRQRHREACPSCDSYERKPPREFLERLKSLLQKVMDATFSANSKAPPRSGHCQLWMQQLESAQGHVSGLRTLRFPVPRPGPSCLQPPTEDVGGRPEIMFLFLRLCLRVELPPYGNFVQCFENCPPVSPKLLWDTPQHVQEFQLLQFQSAPWLSSLL